MDESNDVPVFQFKNETLKDRCKDVFGCLDELEQKHKAFERSRAEEDAESDKDLIQQGPSMDGSECLTNDTFKHPGRDYHGNRRGTTRYGNDKARHHGDFKIPNRPVRGRGQFRGRYGRGRSAPDYKTHPERWTEYSLENVDTSNSLMKQAAFDFLHERKQLRENEVREEGVNLESVACSKGLISFKKPIRNKSLEENNKISERKETVQMMAMEEEVDADVDDIEMDSNVEMSEDSVTDGVCKSESRNPSGEKRKHELVESLDSLEGSDDKTDENKNTGFKSRKISRKNIRSRTERNDSDSD